MGRALVLEALAVGGHGALAHYGVADYYGRFLCLFPRLRQGVGDGGGVVAVDFNHVPVPCAVLGGIVLGIDGVDHRRELHLVAVVEHDQVRQAEIACQASGALGYFLLDAAVGYEGVGLVGAYLAESGNEEAFGQRAAYGHGMPLAERSGGVLDAAFGVDFGMAGSHGAPLAELLEFGQGVAAGQGQNRIEHRRHMAGIEEKAVAGEPGRVVRVRYQKRGVENVDEVSAAHGASGVS